MYRNRKKIAVFGAGGFGLEVAMLIEQINEGSNKWELIGFFDDGIGKGKIINGYPVLGGVKELNQWDRKLLLVIALGQPGIKKAVCEKIKIRVVNNNVISFMFLFFNSC